MILCLSEYITFQLSITNILVVFCWKLLHIVHLYNTLMYGVELVIMKLYEEGIIDFETAEFAIMRLHVWVEKIPIYIQMLM